MAKKYAKPVRPNAGVEAWYRTQLQAIVASMSQDMMDQIRRAWRDSAPLVLAHDVGITRACAGVVIRYTGYLRGAVFLLLERSDGTGWGLPGGGIEPGESPEAAVRRECREEMGAESAEWVARLTFSHVQDWHDVRFLTYTAHTLTPFIPVLNDEHTAHRWVTFGEALAMKLHPGVRATLNSYWVAQDAKPSLPGLLERALARWGGLWTRRIEAASTKLAWNFAAKNRNATDAGVKRVLADAGFTVKFKPTTRSVSAFEAVVAENVGLIKSIPAEYLADVQASVWQSVMAGSDLSVLTNTIQEKYGIAHRRAAFIATDQNHKAKAAMEKARRLELGITTAKWKHSHAGKVPRPSHVKMDGKDYDIATGMYDSAIQKNTWPGVEPRCRCTDQAKVPGFE